VGLTGVAQPCIVAGEGSAHLVAVALATGAMLGDNLGFWVGREGGYRLLCRYSVHAVLPPGRRSWPWPARIAGPGRAC
jgi:hypothetical protein